MTLLNSNFPIGRSSRYALRDYTDTLNPETDFHKISQILATQEFPWDITQALSFALFRTYGIPTIGGLLDETTAFTDQTHKRYDDTVLILDAILEHGPTEGPGRLALKRMNQMHGSYAISNDDMRYVLATFAVCPVRWIAEYGWRPMTSNEIAGITNYYRNLGKHMGIKDIPTTQEEFAELLDTYEAKNFQYTDANRRVADSTLQLLTKLPPNKYAPATLIRQFSFGLMDEPLLDAFRYAHPSKLTRQLATGALKLRGRALRFFPPRKKPLFARESMSVCYYNSPRAMSELGTFPRGCPVSHTDDTATALTSTL